MPFQFRGKELSISDDGCTIHGPSGSRYIQKISINRMQSLVEEEMSHLETIRDTLRKVSEKQPSMSLVRVIKKVGCDEKRT